MLYRQFGNTGVFLSALGIGTNRFKSEDLIDEAGLERTAEIICKAIDLGINYIDTSHLYSQRKAENILKIAFKNIKKEYHVTTKARYDVDKTSDDVLRRIENSLNSMGIDKSTFFNVWYIKSYEEYEQIMKKGGLYDGAIKAKERGLIDHICFSTHAPVSDIVKILNEGIFEGVTISYSLLNYKIMDHVLSVAKQNEMGVITMNSLGGGIIPSNKEFFDFVKICKNETVAQAALKFIYTNNEVTSMLSGMSSMKELEENIESVDFLDEFKTSRKDYVDIKIKSIDSFCTGCDYCSGCPANIPISSFMQSYNAMFFSKESSVCRCKDEDTAKKINSYHKLKFEFNIMLKDSHNPCIKCGKCERKCPQCLPIQKRIAEIYRESEKICYNISARKERMKKLTGQGLYKSIGLYPAGVSTNNFIEQYKNFFVDLDFKIHVFDSNPQLCGKEENNFKIHGPEEIVSIKPDCIIITNYNYTDEIYESIKKYDELGIKIIKMYRKGDVPWLIM